MSLTLCRNLFYRLTKAIADNDFILDMAKFSLFTQRVRDEVIRTKTSFPFIRNELVYVGFRKFGIDYDREPRITGKGNYKKFTGMFRMIKFAVAGILTASTFPLRLIFNLAIPFLLSNFAAIFFYFITPENMPLYLVYTINTMLLITAVTFLSKYMARVYKNGIQRPIFIVDWEKTLLNARPNN
jgi:polyisoprenyl-phosphate glycosyltransferase